MVQQVGQVPHLFTHWIPQTGIKSFVCTCADLNLPQLQPNQV